MIPTFSVVMSIFFVFVVMPYTIGQLLIGWPLNRWPFKRNRGNCK